MWPFKQNIKTTTVRLAKESSIYQTLNKNNAYEWVNKTNISYSVSIINIMENGKEKIKKKYFFNTEDKAIEAYDILVKANKQEVAIEIINEEII